MEDSSKPFIQRKSTIAIAVSALLLIVIAASIGQGAPASPESNGTAAGNSNTQSGGMGSAGQSAEFNQTFANRLREEQAAQAARIEAEVKSEIATKIALEGDRIRLEAQAQQQAVLQRIDAMTAAQRDATAALEEKNRQDAGKSHKFSTPKAPVDVNQINSLDNTLPSAESQSVGTHVSKSVIPPNGFVRGRLLNGVVATVGEAPTAFLVALEGTYKAANGFTVNLNGCMATVEARPNLAAGRIDGKPAEITCNFEQDGRVQTWQVAGWLVDATDGIRGLNSEIVDNTGKKISAAALAQSLSVAGQVLSESQYSSSNGTNGNTRTFTGSVDRALAGGALTGVGQGLSTAINEHYALYKPTLQKGANSRVTLVITNELPVPREGAHITNNTNVVDTKKP